MSRICPLVLFTLLLPAVTAAVAATLGECLAGSGPDCVSATGQADDDEVSLMQDRLQLIHGRELQQQLHQQKQQRRQQQQERDSSHEADAVTATTTLPPTGVKLNGAGDLKLFVTSLFMYGFATLACVFFFEVMRSRYPIMYSHNSLTGIVSFTPDDARWGWAKASMEMKLEEAIEAIGLDNAMMIELCNLMMKIFGTICVPMFFIIGPMNCAFGGNAAGDDHLSYFSFGNVEFGSWMYWVHPFVSWGVVFVVTQNLYAAQRKFLVYRYAWLRKMAEKRANTVMVDHIPEQYQNDGKLAEFFEKVLPGQDNVKSAYVAKDTSHLLHLTMELQKAEAKLQEAQAQWEKNQAEGQGRPTTGGGCCGGREVDSIDHYSKLIQEFTPQVKEERARVWKDAKESVGGVNLSSGFVTFKDRMSAEIALRLTGITEDSTELVLETPPEPSDILWTDFTQDPNARQGREMLGYVLTAGLFFAYMPAVVGITNAANLVNLGPLQTLWASVAPTLGLQFMVAMLPTFLITIYKLCFTLKAEAWSQQKLQTWYFWFQVFFVLLIVAVGTNVVKFMDTLVSNPFAIPGILADTLPEATHYYMKFLVLQWMTHAMVLTRYIPLAKFKAFCQIFEEDVAKNMSEPEDQDYYGLGSRSAQWVTLVLMGIIYGTMSPPVSVLTFITFYIMRRFYGYILVFSETKKPDLGGVFWAKMMEHTFVGLLIYTIVMTGIYVRRGSSYGPAIICAPSIAYVIYSTRRFKSLFAWETLPFQELTDESTSSAKQRDIAGEYMQPEMIS